MRTFRLASSAVVLATALGPAAAARAAQGPDAAISRAGVAADAAADWSQATTYQPPAWPEPPDTAGLLRRVALGTLAVLGLCAATLWAGKRWLSARHLPPGGNRQLRLLETLPLGNRCFVTLLEAGGQQVLVAQDSAGLKALLPVAESFDSALAAMQARGEYGRGFDAGLELDRDRQRDPPGARTA